MYDFDEQIDRTKTSDLKWNPAAVKGMLGADVGEDTIPMWIADMDFRCPPCITEALESRVKHGIFGYCAPTRLYYNAVAAWQKKRNGWDIDPGWIVTSPGVVPALNIAIREFTKKGEKVIIQPPVYDPFNKTIEQTGRIAVKNPLIWNGTRYEMNFEELECLASDADTHMIILCSPHNPVGRVWTEAELTRLCQICVSHHVLIVSDEIHSDLIFKGHKHIPVGMINEEAKLHSIVCTAPSKTFNVPGLKCSNIIIPNEELRNRFESARDAYGLKVNNTMAVEVIPAAYSQDGEDWLLEAIDYMEENRKAVDEFLKNKIPDIRMIPSEGTFLVWLDCTACGLGEKELLERLNHEAGLVLIPGSWFGKEGTNYVRFNIAHPRTVVLEALKRIEKMASKLNWGR